MSQKETSAEVFSAVCAEDFSQDQPAVSSNQRRSTCLSDNNNLVWDD